MLSFPRGTEMFQFPRFPPPALCVQAGVALHDECWVSPFGHLRINAQSTAPRSFSQSLTSFIGSWRQGIHRWLFVAWKNKDARACSAVLKGRRAGACQPSGSGSIRLRNSSTVRERARWQWSGQLAKRSCRAWQRLSGPARTCEPAPSKRKRRQGPSIWRREEDGSSTLGIISTDPPVHQLGTGSNRTGRMPANG